MKRHVWRVNYFFIKRLTKIETSLCFMKKHVWRVSYFFIKQLTKIETSSIFLNSHQKILENSRKFKFQIFTQKITKLEFSLYKTIFSKLNHHYYNLSLYIPIYTTTTNFIIDSQIAMLLITKNWYKYSLVKLMKFINESQYHVIFWTFYSAFN